VATFADNQVFPEDAEWYDDKHQKRAHLRAGQQSDMRCYYDLSLYPRWGSMPDDERHIISDSEFNSVESALKAGLDFALAEGYYVKVSL
jgi:hypothetical protein